MKEHEHTANHGAAVKSVPQFEVDPMVRTTEESCARRRATFGAMPTCSKCGMALEPVLPAAPSNNAELTCPMHPEIVREEPGTCPICGMALEPRNVTAAPAAKCGDDAVPVGDRNAEADEREHVEVYSSTCAGASGSPRR